MIGKIWKENRVLLLFLGQALGLFVGWNVLYYHVIERYGIEKATTYGVANVSAATIAAFGHEVEVAPCEGEFECERIACKLFVDGTRNVGVGDECNALVLIALFAGFILAYPGDWRMKALTIPAGMLAIYSLNVLRVVALGLLFIWSPATVDFHHKVTFYIIVYGFIFGLWMLWAKRLSHIQLSA